MINFESGILERARLFSNFLLIVLLAGNIFFSIQYVYSLKQENVQEDTNIATRVQVSKFLKYFIDTVLNTKGTISFDDRVKLENDIRQIGDSALTEQWVNFVNSPDAETAQANAVRLMSMLTNKMLF